MGQTNSTGGRKVQMKLFLSKACSRSPVHHSTGCLLLPTIAVSWKSSLIQNNPTDSKPVKIQTEAEWCEEKSFHISSKRGARRTFLYGELPKSILNFVGGVLLLRGDDNYTSLSINEEFPPLNDLFQKSVLLAYSICL